MRAGGDPLEIAQGVGKDRSHVGVGASHELCTLKQRASGANTAAEALWCHKHLVVHSNCGHCCIMMFQCARLGIQMVGLKYLHQSISAGSQQMPAMEQEQCTRTQRALVSRQINALLSIGRICQSRPPFSVSASCKHAFLHRCIDCESLQEATIFVAQRRLSCSEMSEGILDK